MASLIRKLYLGQTGVAPKLEFRGAANVPPVCRLYLG